MILKPSVFDVPPPGAGVKTRTLAVPEFAISPAGIDAVSSVDDITFVVRSLPFQRRVEPFTKPAPVTVKAKAAPPAVAEVGFNLVMDGDGLLIVKPGV